jgi:hypothetical protein
VGGSTSPRDFADRSALFRETAKRLPRAATEARLFSSDERVRANVT